MLVLLCLLHLSPEFLSFNGGSAWPQHCNKVFWIVDYLLEALVVLLRGHQETQSNNGRLTGGRAT